MVAALMSILMPLTVQTLAMIYAAKQGSYALSRWVALVTIVGGYVALIQDRRMRRWHVLPLYFVVASLVSLQWMTTCLLHVYGIRWSL